MSKSYKKGSKEVVPFGDNMQLPLSVQDLEEYDSGKFSPSKYTGAVKFQKKCYETHPILEIGGGKLLGGSCSHPVSTKSHIYIGLDWNMTMVEAAYPWEAKSETIQVLFEIQDGQAPKDSKNFIKMVDWVVAALGEGKEVHVGCIGGHGRTGTVLSAIVCKILGEEDAITWVRKNYCKKAVESSEQVEFLHKHYGIKKVGGSRKSTDSHGTVTARLPDMTQYPEYLAPSKETIGKITCVKGKGEVW